MDDGPALVRPLSGLRSADVDLAGGKGANLGELIAGGFPVPDGFVLTTDAYRMVAATVGVDPRAPTAAGDRLATTSVPGAVSTAVLDAWRALGGGPVAVRSSATAEDLPGASFAGQQDTFLGVDGEEALLDAVRRCWASLWTDRAVAYRDANGIDHANVALAVVVQRMVDAAAAGVLFTADPITGRRGRAVIDAAPGLGDAVVSGSVDPDHYAVDAASGAILERHLAGRLAVLDDVRLRELAGLGARVERQMGAPQDIEFAIDRDGVAWLVQSRPITTLYPLPAGLPDAGTEPRVLLSFNVVQGYFEPITPMGLQVYRLLAAGIADAAGHPIEDPVAGPPILLDAGSRLFVDLTAVFRDGLGRVAIGRLAGLGEARSAAVLAALEAQPGFTLRPRSRLATIRAVATALGRIGLPAAIARLLWRPDPTRRRFLRQIEAAARVDLPADATALQRVDAFEQLVHTAPRRLIPRLVGMVAAGQLAFLAVRRLLGDRASEDEIRALVRGAPHNPTTEMDLALWRLAADVRGDAASRRVLVDRPPAEVAAGYRAGSLPPPLQAGLASFLERYGTRAIGEIDIGVPRWSEDPTHILGAIANYVRLDDDTRAPDAQFARGGRQAEATARSLLSRVNGPRRHLLAFFLRRVRALVGTREVPKFTIVRLVLARGRELLRPVGAELAAAGGIAAADDVFFLTLPEVRRALAGEDLRPAVAARRADFERERRRRRIPRVLLSDGTDAEVAYVREPGGGLRGSPASPGRVTGIARVVLAPEGARLEPGEILVAPSTDPGWTPLFLTAGGLVMEMGGMMSHGAVVAREYGIPAVVGVPGATDRISTGRRVTVDGSSGVVSVEEMDGGPDAAATMTPPEGAGTARGGS